MACRILILAEHESGAIRETTFELLGMAHRLAGEAGWQSAEIKAVLIGMGRGAPAEGLAARGAAEAICGEGEAGAAYNRDGPTRVRDSLSKAETPETPLVRPPP